MMDGKSLKDRGIEAYILVQTRSSSQFILALFFVWGLGILSFGITSYSSAVATGGEIFRDSACRLAQEVIPGDFGAMITVVAGVLALVAATTGMFKGFWALLFVSIGAYIFQTLVGVFFSGTMNSCGGAGGVL